MESKLTGEEGRPVGNHCRFGSEWRKRCTTSFPFLATLLSIVIVLPFTAGAEYATTTVTAGSGPRAVAVNPVTNRVYVANYGNNTVTVIDGETNLTTTVATGTGPRAVAVDPVTNKVYVANSDSNSVTVIDGATNSTTTVTSGTNPTAVAVNPDTNRVYVSNAGSGNVTVIDGTNNSTATVAAGTGPQAVAVNSVTNRIYAANYGSNNVTVIDWANKSLTLTFSGTGGGIVTGSGKRNGIPVSFSTNTGVTQYFDIGTTVNLHGEQGEYSIFTGWSEACSGTSDCALPMTDNRDVAAVFDFYTAHKTWIEGTETYKPTLLEAYTAAEPNDIILAWGTDFNGETLILDKNIAVTLKGGYNREYTNDNGGFTTLQGSLTVKSGLLTVEQLIIR